MKYQVGDKILVLHSNEEGEVIDIINDKMVMIEVRGVKFPAYMDQIDFPYYKRFTEKKLFPEKKVPKQYIDQVPKEKRVQVNAKETDGVWLTLIPKFSMDEFGDEVVELFKLHLINRTLAAYSFEYKQGFFSEENFSLKNEINSFQDFYLHDIQFAELNDHPSFSFIFSLLKPEKNKADHYEYDFKLKPKQVFQQVEEMKQKNAPTINYLLFEKYPDQIKSESLDLGRLTAKGYKIYDASKIKNNLPPARSVIDLHMEKLSDNWKSMSNLEILSMQLSEFEKWYELAIAHYQPSLIVIHGVGSGRLRDEIHELLKTRKEVKTFINQYDPRFGYGATEIFFQY
ncbi:MAG: mismatch repair protein [Chitinophagaceae bacterium]|nr:mismatch repair protein [Chitinophagaceae bacterium]